MIVWYVKSPNHWMMAWYVKSSNHWMMAWYVKSSNHWMMAWYVKSPDNYPRTSCGRFCIHELLGNLNRNIVVELNNNSSSTSDLEILLCYRLHLLTHFSYFIGKRLHYSRISPCRSN